MGNKIEDKTTIKTTKALLKLADNGYILHFDDPNIILVYEGEDIPEEMYRELCSEVEEAVAGGKTDKISITVTVEYTT